VLRLMDKAGPTVWISAAGRLLLVPVDTMLQFHSAGRLSVGRVLGVPSLLLTSTGALSGQPRQAPLFYVAHGDGYGVVGSNFGLARHPAWTTNLLRDPHAASTPAQSPSTTRIGALRLLIRHPAWLLMAERRRSAFGGGGLQVEDAQVPAATVAVGLVARVGVDELTPDLFPLLSFDQAGGDGDALPRRGDGFDGLTLC
jgi:hypothetical protein